MIIVNTFLVYIPGEAGVLLYRIIEQLSPLRSVSSSDIELLLS